MLFKAPHGIMGDMHVSPWGLMPGPGSALSLWDTGVSKGRLYKVGQVQKVLDLENWPVAVFPTNIILLNRESESKEILLGRRLRGQTGSPFAVSQTSCF